MLRSPVAALLCAASTSPAAMHRLLPAGASQARLTTHTSVWLQPVVSSVSHALRLNAARHFSSGTPQSVFAAKAGDKAWAQITVERGMSIARLAKEIAKEFPSLQDKDLTTLALYRSDKKGKTEPGQQPLDSTATVEEALFGAEQTDKKYFVVIKGKSKPPRCYMSAPFTVPLDGCR